MMIRVTQQDIDVAKLRAKYVGTRWWGVTPLSLALSRIAKAKWDDNGYDLIRYNEGHPTKFFKTTKSAHKATQDFQRSLDSKLVPQSFRIPIST